MLDFYFLVRSFGVTVLGCVFFRRIDRFYSISCACFRDIATNTFRGSSGVPRTYYFSLIFAKFGVFIDIFLVPLCRVECVLKG